jgi:signal transduction histidine kinase/ActR/RegA family two-component response regulator
MPDSNFSGKQTALRRLLTLPFVLLITLPALIIATSSLYTGLRAVDSLSERLIADISDRVEQAAVHQLEEAAITLRSTFPSSSYNFGGALETFTDKASLEKRLFELTSDTRTTAYLFYGAENGSFLGVDRGRPGARAAANVWVQEPGKPRQIYTARHPGDRTRLLETETRVFNTKDRPWYVKARDAKEFIWTPIYVSFASGALVTTAAQPVVSVNGDLVGVIAADVELSEISNFMKSVKVSKTGVAFIVDRDGYLVASSAPGAPFTSDADGQKRIRVGLSQTQLERDAARWWETTHKNAIRPASTMHEGQGLPASLAGKVQTAKINDSDGDSVDVAVTRISRIDGIDWDVVVAVPRSDFTDPIVRSAAIMFVVIVGTLIAALQLGLWIVNRVTRDVERLVRAVGRYSIDATNFTVPKASLTEIGTLGDAFSDLVRRLRESLGLIRQKNEELAALNVSLEERVERRTRQLEQKNNELTEEIDRREQLEVELRSVSEAATKQADDKARFMAMLSHELRTPLQSVLAVSGLLSRRLPQGSDDLQVLDAAAKSVLTLIDGVLSYAKLEAGKVTPLRSRFCVRDVVEEALRLERIAHVQPAQTSPASLSIAPDVPAWVWSDAGILRQLIVNLVANARRHAGRNAEIDVSVEVEKEQVPIGSTSDSFFLRISVADDGPGIPEDARGRLFRPFEQVGRGTADPSRGSGLGLAICSLLVRALDGNIQLDEAHERGAKIVFRILAQSVKHDISGGVPLAVDVDASVVAPSAGDAVSKAQVPSLSILLVEDHPINRRLVSEMLCALGHRVVDVASGEDAVARFGEIMSDQTAPFDVVITDLNLPGISGFDVVQRIQSACAERMCKLPRLIALTASTEQSDADLCKEAGIHVRLTKPTALADLDAALAGVHPQLG